MGEIVGLKNKKCVACEGGIEALPESEINRLQKQVGRAWTVFLAAKTVQPGRGLGTAGERDQPAAEAGGRWAGAPAQFRET